MEDERPNGLTEGRTRDGADHDSALSDSELIRQSYDAITAWMVDPTIRQATLIGTLIRLFEQSGREFIVDYELKAEDDQAADPPAAPTPSRPHLRVIDGEPEDRKPQLRERPQPEPGAQPNR